MFTVSDSFKSFAQKMERDLEARYPNVLRGIENISIGRNKDKSSGNAGTYKLGPVARQSGLFLSYDSKAKSYVANPKFDAIEYLNPPQVAAFIQDSLAAGKKEEEIKAKINQYMYYDKAKQKYVVVPTVDSIPGATVDAILGSTAIPYWNIGFMNKVFKQPFAPSYAKNLVSEESFGNPWADVISVFTEAFEGFGRISNAARGTVEMNNSNPVTNEMGQIVEDVVNIAVDYESNIEEQMRAASQPGNFLSGMAIADRERYAKMVIERIHDALIIYGNTEAGFNGLLNVATGGVTNYAGTPFSTIVAGASTTKGADIVEALNQIIGDFLQQNKYMPSEIRINVSTAVMRALTSTVYSKTYNPASPMEVISGRFDAANGLGGGVQSCSWKLVADPMLDPGTPFNSSSADYMIITAPSVRSAFEDQQGLVIAPNILDSFIVPPLYQRGGLLYTMYKRVAGVIAPIEHTVKVYAGVGVQ